MNWFKLNVWPYMKGSLRSWTMHFNAWVAALWAALPSLQDSFPQLQPYLPAKPYQYAMGLLIVGNMLLRVKTRQSLADKIAPTEGEK